MAKIIRLTLVLTVITVIAGTALAFVRDITAGPIKMTKIKMVKAPAVVEVFKGLGTDNDPMAELKEIPVGDRSVYAFPGKKGGKLVAIAIEEIATGYASGLGVMTAIGLDGDHSGKVIRVAVTTSSETPGKGDRCTGPTPEAVGFRKQFEGGDAGGKFDSIDAISGATMTSNGMKDAINKALEFFKANKDKLTS